MVAPKTRLELELKRRCELAPDTHLLTFTLDADKARACKPGQFYNLRPLDSTAPLLRRPVSICDVRPEEEEMDLLVRVVGAGTKLLAARQPGAILDLIGPLGKPFIPPTERPALLIAGGVGVAPLYFLARRLAEAAQAASRNLDTVFCYGARTAQDFVLTDAIESVCERLVLTTQDGSRGAQGHVTVATEGLLDHEHDIFVCGPAPMMNAVLSQMRARGLEGQFSLENQMGCGVGACQGCVVPGRNGLIRVCADGPVVRTELLNSILES